MGTELELPRAIQKTDDGTFVVPISFSEEYLRALLEDGLEMEIGTRIQLRDFGEGLSLFFSPLLPLLICKECGYVGDTSGEATFVDETGETRNAFMENGYAVRCNNEQCSQHGKIKMVSRRDLLKNANLHERPKGEF